MKPNILIFLWFLLSCGRGVPVITSTTGPKIDFTQEAYIETVQKALEITEMPQASEVRSDLQLEYVVLGLSLEARGEVLGVSGGGSSQVELFFEENR